MSTADYEIHIGSDKFNALWDSEMDDEGFPFGEDDDELTRIINEEMNESSKNGRRKRQWK